MDDKPRIVVITDDNGRVIATASESGSSDSPRAVDVELVALPGQVLVTVDVPDELRALKPEERTRQLHEYRVRRGPDRLDRS